MAAKISAWFLGIGQAIPGAIALVFSGMLPVVLLFHVSLESLSILSSTVIDRFDYGHKCESISL